MRRPSEFFSRLKNYLRSGISDVSTDYQLLAVQPGKDLPGWHAASVAAQQHQSFAPLIKDAREGRPRLDFVVAAQAVKATGLNCPLVLEVGCGSAYYSEVLPLLAGPIRYAGIDYSASMTSLAHSTYPAISLLTADACSLPLAGDSCDVVMSGTSLMHIANYGKAIAETVRVAREWCIFHTVPVMARRSTTLLRKHAYGQPVVEIIFNQGELEAEFGAHRLEIRSIFESLAYDVSHLVGEKTWTLTYLCRKE